MLRNKISQIKLIYSILVIIIPLLLILAGINRLNGIFFPPDEFGYWASAATILGKDWSDVISGQSFYAFGYGLLLAPIMKLIGSPIIMYRAAILLNAVIVGINGLFLPKLIKALFRNVEDTDLYFSCFPAAMYVGTLSYMHYSIAESILQLSFTILCFCLVMFFSTSKSKFATASIVLASYMLITHYRTAPIFIFTIISLICGIKSLEKSQSAPIRKKVIVFATFFCIIAIVAVLLLINSTSMQSIYFGAQINRVISCFDVKNAMSLILGFLGKVCYIVIAGMGLAVFGIIYLLKHSEVKLFSLFFVPSLLFCLLESMVFFVGADHFDYIFYGRYTEQFIPILIAIGFACINRPGIYKETIRYGNIICVGVVFLIYILYASFSGSQIEYRGDFIPAISWSMYTGSKSLSIIILKIILAFFVVLTLISNRYIRTCALKWVEVAAGILFIGLAVLNVSHCVYPAHELDKSDIELFDTIKTEEEKGKTLLFLDFPGTNYVGLMQFYLQDYPISVVDGSSEEEMEEVDKLYDLKNDCIIAAYYDFEVYETVNDTYENLCESAHFRLYY